MRLMIEQDACVLGLEGAVACTIQAVSVRPPDGALDDEIAALERDLASGVERLAARPQVAGFRHLLSALGHELTPAGERLARSIAERGMPRHNNVVDAYNLVSARHGYGLGLHDARGLEPGDQIVVRRARGDERITPLFASRSKPVRAGDLVYGPADQPASPMAWLGRRDVDADAWKVSEETRDLVLVVLGNATTPTAANERVCRDVFELIRRSCPAAKLTILPTLAC